LRREDAPYLCLGAEDIKHTLRKYSERKIKWREKLLCIKWLDMKADEAYFKVLTCKNAMEINSILK
jgi:hypothetical protein